MTIQMIGAGAGRTGTHSLKIVLEQLLGGTCHHMTEVFARPDQQAGFTAAANGEAVDWPALLVDFTAIVDFPGALFWRELMEVYPEAPVLLSVRPAEQWWRSASATIFPTMDLIPPPMQPWMDAVRLMFRERFSDQIHDKDAMIAAYERHNAAVMAEVPPQRLVVWTPGDGWEPICRALGLAVPDEPFPHTNTTEQFHERFGGRTDQ
jgi:Sulfotransferase domain